VTWSYDHHPVEQFAAQCPDEALADRPPEVRMVAS